VARLLEGASSENAATRATATAMFIGIIEAVQRLPMVPSAPVCSVTTTSEWRDQVRFATIDCEEGAEEPDG
jgi:hypothetical protein